MGHELMPYPPKEEMSVERLNESNESLFVEKIEELAQNSKDRNKDWFPMIRERYLTHYKQWYITLHKGQIISFCAVQEFDGYYRFNTRQWNGYKKTGLERGVKYNEVSPAMLMMELEFQDFPRNQFFSMEYLHRRPLMHKLSKKINIWFNKNFKLLEGMYMTVPKWPHLENEAWCWQSIVAEDQIPLKSISINEYEERFGKTRKSKQ